MTEQHPALSNPSRMCGMLSMARKLHADGWWDGSSFRDHPCGIIREGLIFENEWRIGDSCEIRAMNNPREPLGVWCRTPSADGCPRPMPPSGCVTVWRTGRWLHDGPWVAKASRILHDLDHELTKLEAADKAERQELADRKAAAYSAKMAALRSAHMETP